MKKTLLSFLILTMVLVATPAQAASYKLTFFYDLNLYNAFAQSTADSFVEDLDSGEQSCSSLLMVASFRDYDPENLSPLLVSTNYKVRNESGRIIASGKFKPKTSRPEGVGSATCRAEVTLSLPKAKFYDVEITGRQILISGFPFTKFKKNQAKVNIFDWN